MTPADLRQHLAEVLDQNPEVIHRGTRFREFHAALQTPRGWHPLFLVLAERLGDLLNIRIVIIDRHGALTPPERTALYLVRTADGHYRPALRHSRPGASAAGPPSGDADRRRRAPRAAKEPDSGTVPSLSTIVAMPTIQVSPEQRRALDALGRFVARASLDAGDLPVSIIRAAQDVAEPGPEIAALAQMPPHGMRRHLASLLDQNPEVATTLRSRANELGLGVYWRDFRVALQTPQGWHPLFDTLAQFLGDLLNVGVVLIEEEGTQILLGPSSGPALYLVRIGMGRYTAALRGWRPDESATGPSRPSGDAGPGRGTRRTAEQPDPANVASVSTGESEPVTEPTDGGVDPQAPPVNRAVVEFAEGDWTRPSGTEVLRDFVDRLTGPDDPLRGGTAAIRIEGGGNGRRLDRARALRSGLHRARAAFPELRALLRARAGQGWLPPTGLTYLITTRGSGPPIINQAPASEPDGTADQRQRQVHVVATTIPGRGRVGGRPTTQAGPDHQADASNLQTPTWLPFDHLDRGLSEQARRVVTEVARAVVARARHTPPDDELVVWIEGGGNRNVRHPGEAWQSGQERAAEVWLELKPEIDGALPELAPLITYVVTSRGPDPSLFPGGTTPLAQPADRRRVAVWVEQVPAARTYTDVAGPPSEPGAGATPDQPDTTHPTPLDPDTAALLSPVPPVAYPPSASTRSDQPPSPEAGDPASPFPGDDRLSARQDDQPTVMLATVDAITWPYASQLPVDAAGFHQIQDATVEALLPDLPRQAGASAELMESVAGQPDLAAAVLQTLVEAAAAEAVAQRLTGVDREVLADLGISGGDWVQPGQVRGYADAFAELRDRYETAVDGIPEGSAQREATRITQAFDRAVTAQARQVGMPLTQFVHVRDTYQQLHALIGDVGRQTPPVDGPEVFIVTIADPDDAAAQPDTGAHAADSRHRRPPAPVPDCGRPAPVPGYGRPAADGHPCLGGRLRGEVRRRRGASPGR